MTQMEMDWNFKLCIEKSPKKLLRLAFPVKISLEFILLILYEHFLNNNR